MKDKVKSAIVNMLLEIQALPIDDGWKSKLVEVVEEWGSYRYAEGDARNDER